MKLFKNFKTKRRLREENTKLRGMLHPISPQLHTVECDVQKVSHAMMCENEVPTEYIKEQIARSMVGYLQPLIEWNIEDDTENLYKKRIRGNLYVVKRKGC